MASQSEEQHGRWVLIETYRDLLAERDQETVCTFVTRNKQDFFNMGVDERQPHPDIADLFADEVGLFAGAWRSAEFCDNI